MLCTAHELNVPSFDTTPTRPNTSPVWCAWSCYRRRKLRSPQGCPDFMLDVSPSRSRLEKSAVRAIAFKLKKQKTVSGLSCYRPAIWRRNEP